MVLQLLHLAPGNQELPQEAVERVVTLYYKSRISGEIHIKVQEYVGQLTSLKHADRDILDKIIELINLYSIGAGQLSDLRERIRKACTRPDEP